MKKIFIILSFILSVTSFSTEVASETETKTPTIENISVTNLSNEQFIQNVMGNIDTDSEITTKMDEIGELVDAEVQKPKPDWNKVEQLYNELSIYTNKLAVSMMRTLKEEGVEKTEPNIEEEINSELMSDMNLDQDIPTNSLEEKEIMDAIRKEMPDRDLERMEYLSSKIATEIERPKPDWDQVEKDYNELSRYTNKVTVIIMKVEKNRNKSEE
ncbi:hypothetical protein [Candidatus Cetobacterium colombiensis]|uniref:Uncharacterized protein n=1 Tax=Candidatus Cetobacterium colombiensis TaxID=3073100 RepID=A0ABU4W6U7_9FUSO|nr:hypothetical protein [Candidatus Cetobacterium colombiensis]MDX8335252.1 hypothetical protein [Candidatus Cetobacterium colombiensis]